MEKSENFIHVKFDYDESKEYRRELLVSELSLIKVLRAMKNYKGIRGKELDNKIVFQQKLKELNQTLKNFDNILPKPKTPKSLEKKPEENIKKEEERISELTEREISPIEKELMEIKRRLDSLQ